MSSLLLSGGFYSMEVERGVLEGVDLSRGKNFHMPYSEGHALQFRAELFNAFNTPQFANPDANLGDGAFGQVTSTSLPTARSSLA
jgi:hypothetical protein